MKLRRHSRLQPVLYLLDTGCYTSAFLFLLFQLFSYVFFFHARLCTLIMPLVLKLGFIDPQGPTEGFLGGSTDQQIMDWLYSKKKKKMSASSGFYLLFYFK